MRQFRLGLTRTLEQAITWTVAVLVLVVLWGVASRFVIPLPSRWTEELATFLLIWVTMLGAALGFSHRQHLGVDFVAERLDPDAQRLLAILVQLLIAFFACSVMIVGGYFLVANTLASGQVTPALGIKMGWVYLAVPIGGFFIVLFAFEQFWELFFLETPISKGMPNSHTAIDQDDANDVSNGIN